MASPNCHTENRILRSVVFILEWEGALRKPIISSRESVTIMGFFDSEVVQSEAKNLFEDYQSLTQLGGEYGKFDREGKILFIEKMEELMERYQIFMKRFELSDDFSAKMTVEQLKTQLGQFGMTPQQMFDQMHMTLERMKSEIKY